MTPRVVVAVAVLWRGKVGLFRRSHAVAHDQGRWHCITGYLERGVSARHQALLELHEETGLGVADLVSFDRCGALSLADQDGHLWTVHTYRATTTRRRLQLNEEHDGYRWVPPAGVARYSNQVSWLEQVLVASGVVRGDTVDGPACDDPLVSGGVPIPSARHRGVPVVD